MPVSLELAAEVGGWQFKPFSSARDLQLKDASQREQEPLDAETEEVTLLEAVTKQHD
jgi:hypothetical protein